jgi:hypothetical protein
MSSSKREDRTEKVIDKAFDETKESTKRVLQEVSRELPEVTATFHDYQQQNIKAIRQMTNDFLESQKQLAKSMQLTASPLVDNAFTMMFFPWAHPQIVADAYVRSVTDFADACVSSAKLSSDMMQVGLESTRNSIEMLRNNNRAVSEYVSKTAQGIADVVIDRRQASR